MGEARSSYVAKRAIARGDRVYDLERIRRRSRKCGRCRKQFTVRTVTILASSRVPLIKWLHVIALTANAKSSDHVVELQRVLALEKKSARLVGERAEEAVRLVQVRFRAEGSRKPR